MSHNTAAELLEQLLHLLAALEDHVPVEQLRLRLGIGERNFVD